MDRPDSDVLASGHCHLLARYPFFAGAAFNGKVAHAKQREIAPPKQRLSAELHDPARFRPMPLPLVWAGQCLRDDPA